MTTQKPQAVRRTEESYRAAIKWERVASVTHCVDCYPEACPFKAYIAATACCARSSQRSSRRSKRACQT